MDIGNVCAGLRSGASVLCTHTAQQKNRALAWVIDSIDAERAAILQANEADVAKAESQGVKKGLIDRLRLSDERINSMIDSIRVIISQTDPVGQYTSGWSTPNGLQIRQIRVPLGVAAIIYESRPNVTVDAFALAYKSGNAILLRGSSSALNSNKALIAAIVHGLKAAGVDGVPQAVYLAGSGSHDEVEQILNAEGLIDVVLPRGGAALIKRVVSESKIPVIETGSGVCHLFVDESADIEQAVRIAENGKLQRPGVCNALETIIVHRAIMVRCDTDSFAVLSDAAAAAGRKDCVIPATEDDFGFEFLDYILAVKTVSSLAEAIDYINTHNTRHSESICTRNLSNAKLFQQLVDAACVYVNASTRFTDGGEFGFGAELGISTQKLHVRGPMGLSALTTTKYLIDGEGQIR